MAVYDRIGKDYNKKRRADGRIVQALRDILSVSPSASIADIGAGTGNYSRALGDLGFRVKAIEPSATMRNQAMQHEAVQWFDGVAERLPLADASVDAVICILASHHFSSLDLAIKEMGRICKSGPIVWMTFDPREGEKPWLADYFPTIWADAFRIFPSLNDLCILQREALCREVEVVPWLVPHDLEDCFIAAGWRRPWMYFDPEIRTSMSAFAVADTEAVDQGLLRLENDLRTGKWESDNASLLNKMIIDWGYRFVIAR